MNMDRGFPNRSRTNLRLFLLSLSMNARKYNSPLLDELLSEITPFQMWKTRQRMRMEDFKYRISNYFKITLDRLKGLW